MDVSEESGLNIHKTPDTAFVAVVGGGQEIADSGWSVIGQKAVALCFQIILIRPGGQEVHAGRRPYIGRIICACWGWLRVARGLAGIVASGQGIRGKRRQNVHKHPD